MKKIITVFIIGLAFISQVYARNLGGGFEGPGLKVSSVAEALKLADETPVVLEGSIVKSLGHEKYLFKDSSGSVVIEIDNDDWNGITVKPENIIEIKGEVDKEIFKDTKIDVDSISLKK